MIEIDIKEPIWRHPRSLGLHIPDNYDGMVKISCSYKTINGKVLYPDAWIIHSSKLRDPNYPVQYKGKIKLHIIPISTLTNLNTLTP